MSKIWSGCSVDRITRHAEETCAMDRARGLSAPLCPTTLRTDHERMLWVNCYMRYNRCMVAVESMHGMH